MQLTINRGKRLISAALGVLLAALSIPTRVYGASILVNTNADTQADDGVCTLREAIIAANTDTASGVTAGECAAGSGSDAITFDNNYTITLGSQLPAVTTTMTITGNGAANTIIQASTCEPINQPGGCGPATYRVLEVGGTGNLTLNSLTVRHGSCINGTCATFSQYGGGIYNAGTLVLNGSIVSFSKAFSGGAIYSTGDVLLDASTVSGSRSSDKGGGIYSSGTLTIQSGSTIGGAGAGNRVSNYGAGIYNDNGTVTIDASTVSANVQSGGYGGGGIYNYLGTVTIQNSSTIGGAGAGNSSDSGGGVYNAGTLVVDASTVSANTSSTTGGGIFNAIGATATIQNGSVIGGVGASNSAVIGGGGILVYGGIVTVTGSSITANTGTGIWMVNAPANVTITSSTVSANSGGTGGGIHAGGGTLLIQNGSVIGGPGAGNSAVTGGGIYISNGTNLTINNSTVSYNSATGQGGGIYDSIATLTIQNGSHILNNTAANGGAVYHDVGSASITGSCIAGNSSTAVYNNSSTNRNASGNWWGHPSGPGGVGPGLGDTVSTKWTYSSWLAAASVECYGGPFYLAASRDAQGQIDLAWTDAATDETEFRVERSPDGSTNWTESAQPAANAASYHDGDPNCSTVAYYRVRAYRSTGGLYSNYSNVATADPCGPSGLSATLVSPNTIDLSWTDNSPDETEFRVERSLDGSTGWTEIAQPAANSTSYQDSGLTCLLAYYYRVRAYRSGDSSYSSYSNIANAATCAPVGLNVSVVNTTTTNLTWTDNSNDETGFRVERSPDGMNWEEIAALPANTQTYKDTKASCSTAYYRVRAYRSSDGAYSSYTNISSIDTHPCLVGDGSIEVDTNSNYLPDRWSGSGLNLASSGDGRDCTAALIGSCSMRMVGDGTTKSLFQTIVLRQYTYTTSGGSGQQFTFSVASQASGANGTGIYEAVATVYLINNTTLTQILTFTTGTHGFETKSVTFDTSSMAYAVVVTLSYGKSGGTVWFDNVSLTSP